MGGSPASARPEGWFGKTKDPETFGAAAPGRRVLYSASGSSCLRSPGGVGMLGRSASGVNPLLRVRARPSRPVEGGRGSGHPTDQTLDLISRVEALRSPP